MVEQTKNAPHKRRNWIRISQSERTSIIQHRPVFIDREKDDFTPLGYAIMLFACLFIITQGAIVVAPLYWLGLISL